nr:RNA polymerase-binding protein DksA [Phytohalomonas tamaricis]
MSKEALLAQPESSYMSTEQRHFFRVLLEQQLEETLDHIASLVAGLRDNERSADEADRASAEEEQRYALRVIDRERKLASKIREALERVETDDFGYCEMTGEPIGLQRLLLRPTATLCIAEKERQEYRERRYRS